MESSVGETGDVLLERTESRMLPSIDPSIAPGPLHPLPGSSSGQVPNLLLPSKLVPAVAPAAPTNASAWRALNPEEAAKELASPRRRSHLLGVVFLGSCFALIFWSFNVAQSLVTTLHPDVGFLSLGVVYGTFALGSLVAPSVCDKIGNLRLSIFVGSLSYVGMIAAVNQPSKAVLLVVAAWNGTSAGVMWIAQGTWLSRMAQDANAAVGFYGGVFFTLFNVSGILGNAAGLIALAVGLSTSNALHMMTTIAAVGAAMILLAPEPPVPVDERQRICLSQRLRGLVFTALEPRTLFLLPSMIVQGTGVAFSFGNFPQLSDGETSTILWCFLSYGFSACFFSFVLGRIYDSCGYKFIVIPHVLLTLLNYALLAGIMETKDSAERFPVLVVSGAFLGCIDNMSNSICNMTIIQFYTKNASLAFSVYRFTFCMGFTVAAVMGQFSPHAVIMIWGTLLIFLYAASYFYLRLKVIPFLIATDGVVQSTEGIAKDPEAQVHVKCSDTTSSMATDSPPTVAELDADNDTALRSCEACAQ